MGILAEGIVNFYNQDSTAIHWRIFNWLQEKYENNNKVLIQAPNDMDYIKNFFWTIMMLLYISVVMFLPQFVAYSIYGFALLRYKHRIDCRKEDIAINELFVEKKAWCKENKIKVFWFYEWYYKNILFILSGRQIDNIGFASKEDAMAFKLRWS